MAKDDKKEKDEEPQPESDEKEKKTEIGAKSEEVPKIERVERTPSAPEPKPAATSSATYRASNIMTKILLVVLLIIASLNLYYAWRANQTASTTEATTETSSDTTKTTASSTDNSTDGTDVSATSVKTTSTTASVSFEKALNAKDYNAMKPLLAATVNFILDATECCGDVTADKAIAQLKSRIEDTSVDTYNFSSSQQIVQKMKTNLPESFSKWNNIGISNGKDYLAYNLDTNVKVSEILMGFTDTLDLE